MRTLVSQWIRDVRGKEIESINPVEFLLKHLFLVILCYIFRFSQIVVAGAPSLKKKKKTNLQF